MTTVEEVLHQFDTQLSESDIADGLAAALSRIPGASATALTAPEVAFLREHGGPGIARQVDRWDPAAERVQRTAVAAQQLEDLIGSTASIDQAAKIVGVDRSRISRRLSSGALFSLTLGSRRRIPLWQFQGGAELPGLAEIVAAIPPGAHPSAVEGLMRTAQDELDGQTPIAHLVTGGAVRPVADLVAALGRW